MKRKVLIGSILIVIMCMTSLLWLQRVDHKDESEYTSVVILPNNDNKSFMIYGETYLSELNYLSAQEDGIVTSISVKPGDQVKQGQIMAALDVDLVELKHIESLHQVRAKSIATEKIKPYIDEITRLENNKSLSFIEASRLKADLLQMVNHQLSYLNSIDERLKKYKGKVYVAPFDGVIRDVRLKVGQKIMAKDLQSSFGIYMTPMKTDLMVDLEVTDELMSFLHIDQKVVFNLPMSDLPEVQGSIIEIPQVSFEDKKKKYFKVKAKVTSWPKGYYAGMRVHAQITSPNLPGAIWIPRSAFDLHIEDSKISQTISYINEKKTQLTSRSIAGEETFKKDSVSINNSNLGKKATNEVFPTQTSQSEIYILSEDKKVIKVNVLRGIESKNFIAVYAPELVGSNVIIHYQHKTKL